MSLLSVESRLSKMTLNQTSRSVESQFSESESDDLFSLSRVD